MKKQNVCCLVILLLSTVICSVYFTSGNISYYQNNMSEISASSLSQEIFFEYESSLSRKEYNVSITDLELDKFNCLRLYFITSGASSDSSGLRILFRINQTEVLFTIELSFQDHLEHDLTKSFFFPTSFTGTTNITIICEGKTGFFPLEGTLTILSTTAFDSIAIPYIETNPTSLPIVPNEMVFQGTVSGERKATAVSVFNSDSDVNRLNLTLFYSSNYFAAIDQYIEIEINGTLVVSKEFEEGIQNSMSFLLSFNQGLNIVKIHFVVDTCAELISIYNIQLYGNTYNLENYLPANTLDYFHWQGNALDHAFDLSSLKPQSNIADQILSIKLDYGYLGTKISPAIEYSINLGSDTLANGNIPLNKQTNLSNSIELDTYTTSYQSPLILSVSGTADGEGIFYILNSSMIEIKPIIEFSNEILERTLIVEKTIETSVSEPLILTFYDVFHTPLSVSSYDLTISCELSDEFDNSISSEFTAKINSIIIVDSFGWEGNYVNITNETPHLLSGFHEVNLTMVVYGNGASITIKNLKYQISTPSSSSSTPPDFPIDPLDGKNGEPNTKEPVSSSRAFSLGIVGLIDILALVVLALRSNKKRKEKNEHIYNLVENFDLTIEGINIKQGWFSSLITGTKNLWSRITETAIKALLSFLCIAFLFGKYFMHNELLNNINSIAEKDLGSISFVSGGNAGYIVFFLCLCVSTVSWYSIIILSSSSTYYEDYFSLATIVGLPVVIVLPVSWVLLIFYIFRNVRSFDSGWTILLPLCFSALYFLTFRLGKVKDNQRLSFIFDFIRKGKVPVTMSKESEAASESEPTPEVYTTKQLEEQKRSIRNLIITEIDHTHPVPLERFAEVEKLPLEIAEKHLIEISNETPSLGKYYRLEKYYVKNMKTVEIGNQMIISEENFTYSKILKDDKELDRTVIERDSEVNWVGMVRHRPNPSEGWITLPAEMKNKAELGSEYDVFLFTEEGVEVAFTTILKKSSANSWFFYISAAICSKSNLYGKKVSAFVKKHKEGDGFPWKKEDDLEEMDILEWKKTKKVIEWEGTIRKGGGGGTGWLTLPIELRESTEPGQIYDLSLMDSKLKTHVLTAKLSATAKGWGFYIPKALCIEHSLVGEIVNCYIYQMEHFPVRISADKIVRLPHSVVEEYGIKENDLFKVEAIVERAIFREVVLISKIDRSNRSSKDEFLFTLRLSDVPTSTEARIKILNSIEHLPSELDERGDYEKFYLPKLFPDAILGKVHENEMIIFLGNHVPIFTQIRINLLELIHYFGCYYADGTKKGWAWRINASTPEQAVYYFEKYNELVYGNRLVFRLTYSKKPSDKRTKEQIKEDLIKYWKEQADVEIEKKNISLRDTKHDNVQKWNKCGSLGIRDDRNLVMELHLRMLEETKDVITHNINDEYIWQFLFGILEGDGFVSGGKSRLGVGFSTHSSDAIIENSLIRLGINYRVDRSRVRDGISAGVDFHFGLFEVLQNLDILSEYLFVYYPKRRQTFITRLINQASVQNLLNGKRSVYIGTTGSGHSYSIEADKLRKLLDDLSKEIE